MSRQGRSVVIAEDEPHAAAYLSAALAEAFDDVRSACTGAGALRAIASRPPDLLFLDLRLPDLDGLEILAIVRQRWPRVRVICVTATDDIPTVVEAVHRGATDYLVKPVAPAALLSAAGRALAPLLPGEVPNLQSDIVGETEAIRQVRQRVALAARSDLNVLISGETGTGKELVARAIHRSGGRAAASFLAFNCATTPPELFDSTFFGHRRGSFTGADRDHDGLFVRADGGTLLLDELESLGVPQQAKLLRVLDDGEVRPVGARDSVHVSVRILAATNRDAPALIREGLLRDDLYHRLRGLDIHLPPLRQRREDIPALAAHFLREAAGRLTVGAVRELVGHPWPGNVRELRNVLSAAVLLAGDRPIASEHLSLSDAQACRPRGDSGAAAPEPLSLCEVEAEAIRRALRDSRGRCGQAARALGIDRSTLRRKMRGLDW